MFGSLFLEFSSVIAAYVLFLPQPVSLCVCIWFLNKRDVHVSHSVVLRVSVSLNHEMVYIYILFALIIQLVFFGHRVFDPSALSWEHQQYSEFYSNY